MTAVMIHRAEDSITVVSDGAAYDEGGIFRARSQKVSINLHQPSLVAVQGQGYSSSLFSALAADASTFDDLVKYCPGLLVSGCLEAVAYGDPINLAAFIGGYSERRARFEAYVCFVSGLNFADLKESSAEMCPIESFHANPYPCDERLTEAGLLSPDGELILVAYKDVIAFMELIREEKRELGPPSDAEGYTVGGFVQVTRLFRDRAETEIIHRWPDVIGEPLNSRKVAA